MRQWVRHLVGAAAVIGLCTTAAGASVVNYYHAGTWQAFSGRDQAHRLVCGMDTANSADGMRLTLTTVIGADGLFFRLSKPTWKIPKGSAVTVLVQIGHHAARPYRTNGATTNLDWTLDDAEIARFDGAFRSAEFMTLSFPDGTEPPWRVSLAGSTAVDRTFAVCVRDLTQRQRESTAGGAPSGPTQPFGRPPAQPTQPMIQAQPLAPPAATSPAGPTTAPNPQPQ
ncbi:MAG: hypothetical protein KGL52_02905 [Rhodospirillales bacterium]|nr:hypothetical protein [Rhodospirillales bacterium]